MLGDIAVGKFEGKGGGRLLKMRSTEPEYLFCDATPSPFGVRINSESAATDLGEGDDTEGVQREGQRER